MANDTRLKTCLGQWEGRENTKYKDDQGNWTIGIGHLFSNTVQPDAYVLATGETVEEPTALPSDVGSIPEDAIDAIFDDDLEIAKGDAMYYICRGGSPSRWHSLSHVRQEVLINMAFQLGRTKLCGFTKTRTHILAAEWEEAHDEMLKSKWAKKDTPTRAGKMADAMETNNASHLYKY